MEQAKHRAHTINLLVYSGEEASSACVHHAVETLKCVLEPYYAVTTVSKKALLSEPWMTKTSALVFVGDSDQLYTQGCGSVVSKIQDFVRQEGGGFIGMCAGGTLGASRCEIYSDTSTMRVFRGKTLCFYPGVARDLAFPNAESKSHHSAKVVTLNTDNGTNVKSYYKSACSFISPESYGNVEVLARYSEVKGEMVIEAEDKNEESRDAAVVLCKDGAGTALLIGPQLEKVPEILLAQKERSAYETCVLKELTWDNENRKKFLRNIFARAGLKVNTYDCGAGAVPLTPIYLSVNESSSPKLKQLKARLNSYFVSPNHYNLKSSVDEFEIYEGFENSEMRRYTSTLNRTYSEPKVVVLPNDNESCAPFANTPLFDAAKFFKNKWSNTEYGSILLYGEVVTSTSAILDSNESFLSLFPQNSVVFMSTNQVKGKGRGGNVWVGPVGTLATTISTTFPLVSPVTGKPFSIAFIQYLSSLALCKAVKTYASGYENIPVKIKWPNDLYIMDPQYYFNNKLGIFDMKPVPLTDMEPSYVKCAGTMINSRPLDGAYSILVGTGLNATNLAPSVSIQLWVDIINDELRKKKNFNGKDLLAAVEHEKLLAMYVNHLNAIMDSFINEGPKGVLNEYYQHWLHSSQIITLTECNSVRAKIVGITEDYGYLIAKELMIGSDDFFTGTVHHLRPDGNTFDIFKGLISKKVYS